MKLPLRNLRWLTSTCCAVFLIFGTSAGRADEVLYIGDEGDNTVKRFDAAKGTPLGTLTSPPPHALLGPRGVIVHKGDLLVINQDEGTTLPGELLQLDKTGRKVLAPLVAKDDPHAPALPRGVVRWRDNIFVADLSSDADVDFPTPGRILKYTSDGKFVATMRLPAGVIDGEFHPRGLVVGPDDLLYVSNFPDLRSGLGGQILRFFPDSAAFFDVFFRSNGSTPGCGCANEVNRPEGLVFGPDGRIYMTSFRANPNDNDKIVIVNGPGMVNAGGFNAHIELYTVGKQPRAFAQALLFGPGGDLFVPISNTGGVRRYDLRSRNFTAFVSDGDLLQGWFWTFDGTDPGTLAYKKN